MDRHIADIQARIDAGHCELTGLPFKKECGPVTFDTPSIDRIIPAIGYVYTNIRIVCFAMNVALHNWGEEVLFRVVEAWKEKREGR